MGFYNKTLAQQVANYVVPGVSRTQPLDVLAYGGQFTIKASAAGGGGTASILAAPGPNEAWRLHRFLTDGAGAMNLIGASGFRYGAVATFSVADDLDGQLVTEALTIANSAAGAASGYLTYDVVTLPQIT